jgi:hypothetical protein
VACTVPKGEAQGIMQANPELGYNGDTGFTTQPASGHLPRLPHEHEHFRHAHRKLIVMTNNPPRSRFSRPKVKQGAIAESWHNGADVEIHRYARSLQKAAKALTEKLELDGKPGNDWDVGPIILLYRQALELQIKAVVGEGSNFLASPTDHITLYKTHSLRWLAQIVCQIVKKVGWENEFKCEGVASLTEFGALVNELEAVEPVFCAVHSDQRDRLGGVPSQLQKSRTAVLLPKVDALADLLAATADGLAAEWDLRMDASAAGGLSGRTDFEPTIQ